MSISLPVGLEEGGGGLAGQPVAEGAMGKVGRGASAEGAVARGGGRRRGDGGRGGGGATVDGRLALAAAEGRGGWREEAAAARPRGRVGAWRLVEIGRAHV